MKVEFGAQETRLDKREQAVHRVTASLEEEQRFRDHRYDRDFKVAFYVDLSSVWAP